MADVFISFIHEEEQVAHAVQRLLREQLHRITGLEQTEVFLSSDEWQVLAGENWLDRIFGELRNARVLVSLVSPRSIVRPWVNFEAGAAWLAGKPVVPACFGGLQHDQLPKPYTVLQAVRLPDDGYYLFSSVARYLQRRALIPPPFRHDGDELANLTEA